MADSNHDILSNIFQETLIALLIYPFHPSSTPIYIRTLSTIYYHIFCCNMLIFACPIIAKSQCWLFALRSNIRICPQISVFSLICPHLPLNSTTGICAVVSKYTWKDGTHRVSIKLTHFKV